MSTTVYDDGAAHLQSISIDVISRGRQSVAHGNNVLYQSVCGHTQLKLQQCLLVGSVQWHTIQATHAHRDASITCFGSSRMGA